MPSVLAFPGSKCYTTKEAATRTRLHCCMTPDLMSMTFSRLMTLPCAGIQPPKANSSLLKTQHDVNRAFPAICSSMIGLVGHLRQIVSFLSTLQVLQSTPRILRVDQPLRRSADAVHVACEQQPLADNSGRPWLWRQFFAENNLTTNLKPSSELPPITKFLGALTKLTNLCPGALDRSSHVIPKVPSMNGESKETDQIQRLPPTAFAQDSELPTWIPSSEGSPRDSEYALSNAPTRQNSFGSLADQRWVEEAKFQSCDLSGLPAGSKFSKRLTADLKLCSLHPPAPQCLLH